MAKIKARESQNVEYKSSWHDEYLKWICGFANAQGAVMYFGVDNASRPRNRNIANAFFKAGFIDAWGRGYKKIREGFEGAGLPMPKIESAFGGVMVTFQRNNVNTAIVTSQTTTQNGHEIARRWPEKWPEKWPEIAVSIMKAIVSSNTVTIAELETATGLGHTTIKKILREMQNEQIIRRVGPDKGGHWEIVANDGE